MDTRAFHKGRTDLESTWNMEGPPDWHPHTSSTAWGSQYWASHWAAFQAQPSHWTGVPRNYEPVLLSSEIPAWGDTAALFSLKEKLRLLSATLQSCSILPQYQCWVL